MQRRWRAVLEIQQFRLNGPLSNNIKYPSENITDIFNTLKLIHKCIIDENGGKSFKLPRKAPDEETSHGRSIILLPRAVTERKRCVNRNYPHIYYIIYCYWWNECGLRVREEEIHDDWVPTEEKETVASL